jgi:hypothetical protein
MLAERLELQFKIGAVPEGVRESLLEQICGKITSAFAESSLKLGASAQLCPTSWACDDGIVGRVVGKTDSGIPAFRTIQRDGNGDIFIGHDLTHIVQSTLSDSLGSSTI